MGTNANDKDMKESDNKEKGHESDNSLTAKKYEIDADKYKADKQFKLDEDKLGFEKDKLKLDDEFRKEELKDKHETELAQLDSINKSSASSKAQFDQFMGTPLASMPTPKMPTARMG